MYNNVNNNANLVDDTAIESFYKSIVLQWFWFFTTEKYQQKYQQKILLGVF